MCLTLVYFAVGLLQDSPSGRPLLLAHQGMAHIPHRESAEESLRERVTVTKMARVKQKTLSFVPKLVLLNQVGVCVCVFEDPSY